MINSFSGQYRFLSNFHIHEMIVPINDAKIKVKTLEHAFQAFKTDIQEEINAVISCATPGEAKKLGRLVKCRPNWNDIRDDVMLSLLKIKFQPGTELANKLLETDDEELIEGNWWGDKYWGVCKGIGENKLGILLMIVRTWLKENYE